jgi:hypothetical protein
MRNLIISSLMLLSISVDASPLSDTIYADGFENLYVCPAVVVGRDGEDRTRLVRSDVLYSALHYRRSAVWLLEYDSVWGYNNSLPGPPEPWPGVTGSSPIIAAFRRGSYVSLHFKTPPAPAVGLAGTYRNPTAEPGNPLTMAISRACGDFSNHLPTPGCLRENVPANDERMVYWQFATTSPSTACNLEPNTDYYISIMQTDVDSQAKCHAPSICPASAWRG